MEYYTRSDAEQAMRYINQTRLDDRIIRTDWDAGFVDGRQYGRGKSGGQVCWFFFYYDLFVYFSVVQVRDEYRQDYDPGRGGYGKRIVQGKEMEKGGVI